MRRVDGFTLLELLAVIVIVSVGLAGLAKMFGNTSMALVLGEGTQLTAQYAQECAEYVLGVRKDLGFTSITENTCDSLPALPAGYSRSLSLAANTTGTCPSSSTCANVAVTVSRGTASTTITVMLVQ
ncbi:MAG: type II secretion system protein [Bacillota bacterium]